jgi:hypothetical protein
MLTLETNDQKIKFNKESVKEYLDKCIEYWRKQKQYGNEIARYYIDAYQSVRTSLFGELKE